VPFANKFRAMMGLPLPGDRVGDFVARIVEVDDVRSGWDGYAYTVRMVLEGPGGKAGVRRTLSPTLAQRTTTFSAYGNSYQLWFGKPEIESLGDRRYAVSVDGAGARIDLKGDLRRFLDYLETESSVIQVGSSTAGVIDTYLEEYRGDVGRLVERYRRRLRKSERQNPE